MRMPVLGLFLAWLPASLQASPPGMPVATNSVPGGEGQSRATTSSAGSWDDTSVYEEQTLQGWRVFVNRKLLAEKALSSATRDLLDRQLQQVAHAVPEKPLAKLREMTIWIERSSSQFPCMCYHESREWLQTHGVNPAKTGGIELANPTNFLNWSHDQPWMVLHELAHSYHLRYLGDKQESIQRCYDHANEAKLYESVARKNGHREPHYALQSPKEYFAEMTEAFFGTNDFYPFVRTELKEHDRQMFDLLHDTWCVTNGTSHAPALRQRVPRLHDPSTIVKCGDDYWLFSTGMGITSRRSQDLINWSEGPPVFSHPPAWTTNMVPGNRGYFWAPDAIQLRNQYLLYYSVSTWGKNTSAIGLAINSTLDPDDPCYGWSDGGIVVGSTSQSLYNAIDPSVMLDRDGRLWLAFGSYWTGIKLVELDPRTGLRSPTNSAVYSLARNESIEAACLCRHADHYYLFLNWGQCCRGTNSTYEIRVGRSERVTGPYLDHEGKDLMQGGGSLVLSGEGFRIGPGHAGILKDGAREYLSYHFYHAERHGHSMLEVAPLSWSKDGWPKLNSPLPVNQK